MALFKFKTEFLVRASSREEAEREIQEEVGFDVYEGHFICEEVVDENQEAEYDLVKI